MKHNNSAMILAILAAALYGISSPVSKILLIQVPPTLMAAMLYLGAGLGMLIVNFFRTISGHAVQEARLTRRELPWIVAMIVLDIAAPVFLMLALTRTTAANASLLNNFEIVATAIIALMFFKEAIGRRMWLAIALITSASIILSIEDASSFSFSIGSVFVLLACVCWGVENNCTRMLSLKDPLQIVVIKGFGSGIGSLIIALSVGQTSRRYLYLALALLLGFVAYGLSIYFYILAQRTLGAARTSAYYAVAPFIGVLLSILIFGQKLTGSFIAASVTMVIGAYFAAVEYHRHSHLHEAIFHEHRHSHQDGHHSHKHEGEIAGEHSHAHTHAPMEHTHKHTPDLHHRHDH
jgi:drug/metabolite transporter (DMT)-like permease